MKILINQIDLFHVIEQYNRGHYESFADQQPPSHVEPERLTPFKYTSNHCASSFSAGILVCVKQKYSPNNDIINNVNLIKISKFHAFVLLV